MTDETIFENRQPVGARATDMVRAALHEAAAALRAALLETRGWDAFRWTVIALLGANLLLLVLLANGIKSEIAALKESGQTGAESAAAMRAEIGKEIGDAKSGLAQLIFQMRSGLQQELEQTNARIDALKSAPKPQATTRQKPAKPRR